MAIQLRHTCACIIAICLSLCLILLAGHGGMVSETTAELALPTVSIQDTDGNHIESATVGSPITIVNRLLSDQIAPQPFVCFFEVRDAHQVTQFLAWQNGTLKRDIEKVVGASWVPDKPGLYSFRSFAVSSINNPDSVRSAGLVNQYVIEANMGPITIGTGTDKYDFGYSNFVDVVGRVGPEYALPTTNVVIMLFDLDGEVRRDVVPVGYDGKFYHDYHFDELDYGEHQIVANIEGLEGQTANANFTYGMPELHGILDRLTITQFVDQGGKSFTIGYATLNGNLTKAELNDAGNYSLSFEVNSTGKDDDDGGGLVVQFPLKLLDRMTPLGDRDLICINGENVTDAISIGMHGYGTSNYRAVVFCPFSAGTSSVITLAAITDPAQQS